MDDRISGADDAALKSASLNNISDDGEYIPTVGCCGSEWPSRLAANSFGELCYRPRPIVGIKQLPENDKTNDDFVENLTVAASRLKCSVKWTIDDDTYNLDAFDQCEGPWPIGHPLPLPLWSDEIKAPLIVEKIWQYEDIVARVEKTLNCSLEETNYNSVKIFIDFHKSFRASKTTDLRKYFQSYTPLINRSRRDHICVSLAMEIVHRLSKTCPQLADHLYLVSCGEGVESTEPFTPIYKDNVIYNSDKSHTFVAMRINVAGRDGFLTFDHGYHVARAVTIMRDQCYPHTGWFVQCEEPHVKREYCYTISASNDDFIEWAERTTRDDEQIHKVSLVYAKAPYRTAVDVTIRRNLVANLRSLLSRDSNGRVCAGIHFTVVENGSESMFTLFYDGPDGQTVKSEMKFSTFADETTIPDVFVNHLKLMAPQLHMSVPELRQLLKSLCEVVSDQSFIKQVLVINDHVTAMFADSSAKKPS